VQPFKRILGRGIEDDDGDPAPRRGDLLQHGVDSYGLRRDTLLSADCRIDRNEEIMPVHLDSVTGVVENADRVGAEPSAEGRDGAVHICLAAVVDLRHIEAKLGEFTRNRPRVIDWVAQHRDVPVFAVADYQRDTRWACACRVPQPVIAAAEG
jgi:hypothetical protein